MYTKYLWGALLAALLSAAVANAAGQTADDVPSRASRQIDEDERQQPLKPVLIARRPSRPAEADVETERQSVVVVRQSPRLLKRPREQEQQQDEEDEDERRPQVIIRQQQPIKSIQQRLKEQPQPQQQQQQQREPTAQTIRNYNKLNDDGSFTFGYEADDGSFKEETRGTDCVVRGKYGYVDPDGNKREFSYVQGNPCDPNAVSAEDEDDQPGKPGEEENIPANRPNAPRPKPKKNRPTTTLFQQSFGDFEQPSTTPRQPARQQTQQLDANPRRPSQISPPADRPFAAATPPPLPFRPSDNLETAVRNLPQPSGKPQLASGAPNSPLYTTELVFDPATGQYNTIVFQQVPKQSAGISVSQRLPPAPAPTPTPAALTRQPQFQPHSPPQFQPQPQPQFRAAAFQPAFQQQRPVEFDFQRAAGFPTAAPAVSPQQQLVQQQQALMFQQSQNLFRQQQQKQQQQFQSQFFPPPRFPADSAQFAPLPKQQRFEQQPEAHQQQFVLVQPGRTPGQQSLAAGQIDAFLRGHNVQF